MFQTAMIINTFRLLENSLEIIVIEKFLSRTFLLICIVSSRKEDRGSARRSRLIFLESFLSREPRKKNSR